MWKIFSTDWPYEWGLMKNSNRFKLASWSTSTRPCFSIISGAFSSTSSSGSSSASASKASVRDLRTSISRFLIFPAADMALLLSLRWMSSGSRD